MNLPPFIQLKSHIQLKSQKHEITCKLLLSEIFILHSILSLVQVEILATSVCSVHLMTWG